MRKLLIILACFTLQHVHAQLVVDLADFASNPSKFNGRHIVLRGVMVSKTTGSALSLSGPRTISGTTPTAGPSSSANNSNSNPSLNPISGTPQAVTINANTAPQTATVTSTTAVSGANRSATCTPPRNWELLTVEIPNYTGCFALYSNMAKTLPNNRKLNADITIFVDTNLMHRIARVKIN